MLESMIAALLYLFSCAQQTLVIGGLFDQFGFPDEHGVVTEFGTSKETSAAMLAVRQV